MTDQDDLTDLSSDSSHSPWWTEDEPYDRAEPRADAMIQSLRAFGYDLQTAIADLIDNSITAGAKNVWLDFSWHGSESYIAISDDGVGMLEKDLLAAMRPGERNPLTKRPSKDLGRFGLGLKTASFSQAKRLTLYSKHKGKASVRCWDLDYVAVCGDWRLLRRGSQTFERFSEQKLASKPSGTVVFWEVMDRVTPVGIEVDNPKGQDFFYKRIDQVKAHIAMVFHRFLDPRENPGHTPLKIWINDNAIEPWNPFLISDKATQLLTEETISFRDGKLTVRPYILPHHSKISQQLHKRGAGPKGWNAQQGFYVYRNKRMLVMGSWLGLGFQQEEHYKLARIQIDIPNSMDADWEIDVKKSQAWPPPAIREKLKLLATLTRNQAAAVYRHRGARLQSGSDKITFLWESKVRRNKIFYEINREHPLVVAAIEAGGSSVKSLLHLIEETVPVPTITRDWTEDPTKQASPFEEAAPAALNNALKETYKALLKVGIATTDAKFRLLNIEPFNQYKELIAALD